MDQVFDFHSVNAEIDDSILDVIVSIVRNMQPKYVVESGTYLGKSTRAIANELSGGVIETCDPCDRCWKSERGFKGLPIIAHHCRGIDFKPKQPVNLLFLDSDMHNRDQEVEYFAPFMAPRSIMVIDDPGSFDYSVLGTLGFNYITMPVKLGMIIVQPN